MKRRDALVLGGLVLGAVSLPPILRRLPSEFQFEPIAGFEGFRRLQGGAVSGAGNPFFGLDGRLPDQAPLYENPIGPPCTALFGDAPWTSQKLPVAIFTDFNCPYCKTLDSRLIALRDSGAPLDIHWHDMPLLGDSSHRAARAAIAARNFDREEDARTYLWNHGMRPGQTALRRMAEHLDLHADVFEREIESKRVLQSVSKSLELGMRLGIPGTPGTVLGRTLVIGAIREPDLAKLIKLERSLPPLSCL